MSVALSIQNRNIKEMQNGLFDLLHVLLIMLIKLICKLETGRSCFWRGGGGVLLDGFGRCSVVESNATNLPSSLFITTKITARNGCPKPEGTQRCLVTSEIFGGFELEICKLKSCI